MADNTEVIQAFRALAAPVDWDAVYTRDLPRIYNFFLYKTASRELSEDLTSSTFERAWKLRARFKASIASPSVWLFGIARNVLKEHLHRVKNIAHQSEPLPDGDLPDPGANIEQIIQTQRDKNHLRQLLSGLPEREQELIALKFGAGLTNREIARITGRSESNIGSILHRTVTKLRRKWDEKVE